MKIADRLTLVASRLRVRWGIEVVEVPGWQDRGAGDHVAMRALVRHHTASPRGSGNTASLRVVTHGRKDLRNSLSMWYQPREGRVAYLIAAGVSWHAGRGGWPADDPITGNDVAAGDEIENDGRGEPFTADQMYVARAIETEMGREFGWTAGRTGCEHSEHAPGRKVDRFGIDGEAERRHVAALMTSRRHYVQPILYARRGTPDLAAAAWAAQATAGGRGSVSCDLAAVKAAAKAGAAVIAIGGPADRDLADVPHRTASGRDAVRTMEALVDMLLE